MKIVSVRVTPIAISDPRLLNASGMHEPYALRSIIEVDNGLTDDISHCRFHPSLTHL
jgi:glucarate dehydratase